MDGLVRWGSWGKRVWRNLLFMRKFLEVGFIFKNL
jgi:hypothetical protein